MQEKTEPQLQAPPVQPPPQPQHPQVEVPPGDPFLRGLFPDSPAGYGILILVVICAVLVFRKFLKRARPRDVE